MYFLILKYYRPFLEKSRSVHSLQVLLVGQLQIWDRLQVFSSNWSEDWQRRKGLKVHTRWRVLYLPGESYRIWETIRCPRQLRPHILLEVHKKLEINFWQKDEQTSFQDVSGLQKEQLSSCPLRSFSQERTRERLLNWRVQWSIEEHTLQTFQQRQGIMSIYEQLSLCALATKWNALRVPMEGHKAKWKRWMGRWHWTYSCSTVWFSRDLIK